MSQNVNRFNGVRGFNVIKKFLQTPVDRDGLQKSYPLKFLRIRPCDSFVQRVHGDRGRDRVGVP